ncbi:MAG: methylated-DNA--[protein]-cysteine S-methyltransferase [Rhodospirillaceae bacterium]|jgi:methylated-DNA-[protein]-cysteine S-methyltransferase|nr:methylated-DNA--[protein]-cysteine S-methyltransferase [Rhodospirillaceae bacterium]MBT5193325.1 methylated-DNA--[protein]-cysteine S-methyltransferase [Rhodospirillaceae bacterium]MBT5894891.1 methylated-DNA--[protein]-cysteine S-methyltransferase [Rhodospirillaceae bacterium]MBT6427022.1 methylated-DNA--[protein]-cysteine S-methyltransferase [Rhodospirillaceae bacterium]MBT7665304.1 methylated-DNA--[protein]-cysteine S-methyltransferase [Rhodospirillaceae bacterium]
MSQLSMHSPVGDLTISINDGAVVALDWGWARDQADDDLLQRTKSQLDSYFDGDLQDFDLPLQPAGTDFQRRVWALMERISYGDTMTYGEMAKALNSAARAVGMACGANPIPLIIPCHRVLAANGMGGYSGDGGVETKVQLLRLEKVLL